MMYSYTEFHLNS